MPRTLRYPALTALTAALAALALAIALVPALTSGPADAATKKRGRVHGDSRALVSGCRKVYTYDYRVRVPSDDWSLEISVRNPDGDAIHSAAYLGKPGRQGDPRRRSNIRYKFCRQVTRPGVYVITGKLTYSVGPGGILGGSDDRVARFRDRFRLTR